MGTLETHDLKFASFFLAAQVYSDLHHHAFDFGTIKRCPTVAVVQRGIGEFRQVGRTVTAEPGDLVFIPRGIRYHSVWRGTPDIRFFGFHILSDAAFHSNENDIPLQRIDALSGSAAILRAQEILRMAAESDTGEKLRAISRFIDLYADVQAHLQHETPVKYHSALFAAMKYIEENFTREITMRELEAVTFVGESRLYHLFQSQLGTTPLKYRNHLRIEKAAELLSTTSHSVDYIAGAVGFSSTGYFRQ
ncbi:MAG: helix-turn-helix domain-containing protein, partial [Clostridia bacterium]|nr:helix-turn-helix domain-containing protein [Clostridia bacterium]